MAPPRHPHFPSSHIFKPCHEIPSLFSFSLHSFPIPSSPLLSSFISSFSILSIIPLNYSPSYYFSFLCPYAILVIYPFLLLLLLFPSFLLFTFLFSLRLPCTRICAFIIIFYAFYLLFLSTVFSFTACSFYTFSLLTQWSFLWGTPPPPINTISLTGSDQWEAGVIICWRGIHQV